MAAACTFWQFVQGRAGKAWVKETRKSKQDTRFDKRRATYHGQRLTHLEDAEGTPDFGSGSDGADQSRPRALKPLCGFINVSSRILF